MSDMDYIIETKMLPPNIHQAIKRHFDNRGRIEDGGLMLISAPAGYGKSVLMSQLYRDCSSKGYNCTWLSLGADDNEIYRFIRYLSKALENIDPDLTLRVLAFLEMNISSSLEALKSTIMDVLAGSRQTFYVFIDDYHYIHDSDIHELVSWLCHINPVKIRVIIGSRERLPFSSSTLKLQYQYKELGLEDLKFTLDEVAEVIGQTHSITLREDQLEKVYSKTEGWPAAIQLAFLSLSDTTDIDSLIESISGSNIDLVEYLTSSILIQLDKEQREIMLAVARFDRFCDDLCVFLTKNERAGEVIAELVGRNLLIISLDRVGKWYRFHSLLAEYLLEQPEYSKDNYACDLLSRGANWFIDNGLIDEGIGYVLQAGDYELAANWIANYAKTVVQHRGEHSNLLSWIKRLPARVISERPRFMIYRSWSLAFTHRFLEALKDLDTVEGMISSDESPEADELRCSVELNRCLIWALKDRYQEARQTSEHWINKWPNVDGFQAAAAQTVLAYASKCTSEFSLCSKSLAVCERLSKDDQSDYIDAWSSIIMIVSLAKQGRHNEAIELCESSIKSVSASLGARSHVANMLSTLMGAMLYERNEIARSKSLIDESFFYVKEQGSADSLIAAYLTKARLSMVDGDKQSVLDTLRDGQSLAYARGFPRVALGLLAEEVLFLIRNEKIDLARSMITQNHEINSLVEGVESHWISALSDPLRLRINIFDGSNIDSSLGHLSSSIHRAKSLGQGRKVIELLVLKVLTLAKVGDLSEALRVLSDALVKASPHKYIRIFLDEGAPLKQLIVEMIGRGALSRLQLDSEYIKSLLDGFSIDYDPESYETETAVDEGKLLLGKITEKEESILKLLAEGLSNKRLAASLFVTEGTIKWHLHNIYTKLNVRNRSEAVAMARKLTLVR